MSRDSLTNRGAVVERLRHSCHGLFAHAARTTSWKFPVVEARKMRAGELPRDFGGVNVWQCDSRNLRSAGGTHRWLGTPHKPQHIQDDRSIRIGDRLPGWAYRIRTGESGPGTTDWIRVIIRPEIGASRAAENFRVPAALCASAARAKISADDLQVRERRTACRCS
jgi:hypothetical protein